MKPDFPLLYSQLGVHPDCTLDELKHAYRKRIGELHPDRHASAHDIAEPVMHLSDLNSIYAQALRFHKQYGRLPGGKTILPPRSTPTTSQRETPSRTQAPPDQSAPAPRQRGPMLGILLVVLVLALAMIVDFFSRQGSEQGSNPYSESTPAALPESGAPMRIELGMDAPTVIALQGNPVGMHGDEWDYGPSWLRFKDGKLVDWYSSPLRRLKTSTVSPEAATAAHEE